MSTDSHKSLVGCGDSTSIPPGLRRFSVVGLVAVVELSLRIGGILVIFIVLSRIFSSVVLKLLRYFLDVPCDVGGARCTSRSKYSIGILRRSVCPSQSRSNMMT